MKGPPGSTESHGYRARQSLAEAHDDLAASRPELLRQRDAKIERVDRTTAPFPLRRSVNFFEES